MQLNRTLGDFRRTQRRELTHFFQRRGALERLNPWQLQHLARFGNSTVVARQLAEAFGPLETVPSIVGSRFHSFGGITLGGHRLAHRQGMPRKQILRLARFPLQSHHLLKIGNRLRQVALGGFLGTQQE